MSYASDCEELFCPKKFGYLTIDESVTYMHEIMDIYHTAQVNELDNSIEIHRATENIVENFFIRVISAIGGCVEVMPDYRRRLSEIWNSIDSELLELLKEDFPELKIDDVLKWYGYYMFRHN